MPNIFFLDCVEWDECYVIMVLFFLWIGLPSDDEPDLHAKSQQAQLMSSTWKNIAHTRACGTGHGSGTPVAKEWRK